MNYSLQTLRGDIFGGVTATVVGLPVALAFGVASGLGATAGLYGAIAVGFLAAVFGGTRSQISGPTGPMTVAMAVVVTAHADNLAEAFTIAGLAGLIQILLGVLRIGRFVTYTPYSVISGFMTGIGVIVILLQISPLLGVASTGGSGLDSLRSVPAAMAKVNLEAVAIAVVTLAVGVLWPSRLRKYLPSTLVAMAAGSALGIFWLTGAPVIGEIPTGLPEIQFPALSVGFLAGAVEPALVIALLGSIDSLLTSLIADSLTRTQHNPNRELVGQGIGNMAAAFIGGLPGAGATLGTVVNLRAGGRTPVSGALRAAILLGLVLGLGRYVETIPLAVLAGILLKVGWDIIDWRFVTRIHHVPRYHLVVMATTFALTVFLDLVTAVAVGLIAAGMAASRQLERLELDSVVSVPILDRSFFQQELGDDDDMDPYSARVGLVALRGRFSVASSNSLVNVIGADIRDHEVVIFDLSDTIHLDDSAAMVIEQMIEIAEEEDTKAIVMGLSGTVEKNIRSLDILRRVPEDCIVGNLDEAREVARKFLYG